MSASTAMKKKKSYHHKNLKPALLEMTAHIIAEEGLTKVTLRELARRLGVSRTAPYRHFTDKNTLLAAVAEEKFQGLNLALLKAFEVAPEPIGRLEHMALAYVRFAVAHYDLYLLMFSEDLKQGEKYPGLAEAADETFALLAQAVATCQETDCFKAGDPTRLAYAAWSTLHGMVALLMEGKLLDIGDRESFYRFICQTAIDGLRRR